MNINVKGSGYHFYAIRDCGRNPFRLRFIALANPPSVSTLQRILLITFALLALATLTGCGDKGNAKRESGGNKGALSATTPRECPDVRGSFSAIDPEATNKSFTLWETMLGGGAPRQQGNPWRVMTFAGNADKALEITFSRPTKKEQRYPMTNRCQPTFVTLSKIRPTHL